MLKNLHKVVGVGVLILAALCLGAAGLIWTGAPPALERLSGSAVQLVFGIAFIAVGLLVGVYGVRMFLRHQPRITQAVVLFLATIVMAAAWGASFAPGLSLLVQPGTFIAFVLTILTLVDWIYSRQPGKLAEPGAVS